MQTVDVVIATCGLDDLAWWWQQKCEAALSAQHQSVWPEDIHLSHAPTLAESRNQGAAHSDADWLIFLDADDRLERRYIESMLDERGMTGAGDVRWPSVLYRRADGVDRLPEALPPQPTLLMGNHLVIGSMMRRSLFDDVGGFRELPILEDWDLFIRLALAGADLQPRLEAVYIAMQRPGSRNDQPGLQTLVAEEIRDTYRDAWERRFGVRVP